MRWLRTTALGLVLALVLTACGGDEEPDDAAAQPEQPDETAEDPDEPAEEPEDEFPEVLQIRQAAIRALPNLPVILAPDSPYAEEFGIEIIDVPVTSPTDYVTGLGRGDLDVVPGTPSIAIAARDQGVPVTVILRGSYGNTQFLLQPELGIEEGDWEAFRALVEERSAAGDPVRMGAVTAASTNYVICYKTFEENGIDPDVDIETLNIPAFPEHPGAMERGEVDMLCTTEPFATLAVTGGLATYFDTPFETDAGDVLGALITAERNLTDPERREAVKRWMQVVVAIMQDINEDPQIAADWIIEAVDVDQEAADRMLSFAGWTPEIDEGQLRALAQGHFDIEQTSVNWAERMEEWIDPSVQEEVLGSG